MQSKNKQMVKKSKLKGLIEDFWFEKLKQDEYEIVSLPATKLLTWNRFDLAFKLLYLELLNTNSELAEKIYSHDIRAQTLGTFSEYGNDISGASVRMSIIFNTEEIRRDITLVYTTYFDKTFD